MPDFLQGVTGTSEPLLIVVVRLVAAMVAGAGVALVYRRAAGVPGGSFTNTLVLLAILIATVTQVIGDNVARAFSLVGALSIVRFRTVVRDTQDTAYVIAAVAVGMAVGAGNFGVAAAGLGVVAVAAFAMRRPAGVPTVAAPPLPFELVVRVGLELDGSTAVAPVVGRFASAFYLESVETAKQGGALDLSYRLDLTVDDHAQSLVAELNRVEGVHAAGLTRAPAE